MFATCLAKHDFLLVFSSGAIGILLLSKEQFLMLLSNFVGIGIVMLLYESYREQIL
jgi:hypothetical protein